MSGYPLNNTNYNWERRQKKCKGSSDGGGDSEPFDAKKFGDDLIKYTVGKSISVVYPDIYYIVDISGVEPTPLGPPENGAEFAAIWGYGVENGSLYPLYSYIPDSDKIVICVDFIAEQVGSTIYSEVVVDNVTYYVFFVDFN